MKSLSAKTQVFKNIIHTTSGTLTHFQHHMLLWLSYLLHTAMTSQTPKQQSKLVTSLIKLATYLKHHHQYLIVL